MIKNENNFWGHYENLFFRYGGNFTQKEFIFR